MFVLVFFFGVFFLGGIFVRLKLMNITILSNSKLFQPDVFLRLTGYLEKIANKLEVGMIFCCHFSIHIVFLKFWHV